MEEKDPGTKRRKGRRRSLRHVNPNAAGIDCGSESHHVAVPADRDSQPVREFRTFTTDLHRLADWLAACRIKTVAMEATGVYWIPVFEILEERGFEVLLVNARHVKNVPGRKTDVVDCQWIQQLHSYGLLRGSFRPAGEIATLRAYLRHREKLLQNAGDHVRRIQKALVQMNLQLHTVISDITGETGMRILRDIVAGVTDPKVLASHRHSRCHATEQEIEASLTGNYRREHLFVLPTPDRSLRPRTRITPSGTGFTAGRARKTSSPSPLPARQERQLPSLRDPQPPPSAHRSRPEPDRRHRPLYSPPTDLRDRNGHDSLAQ